MGINEISALEVINNLDEEDLNTMIEYFVETEEYEKCAVLHKLKQK